MSVTWLARLDALRHRVPFWWWLTYDALVGVVIILGVSPGEPAFWLGLGVLAIAVAIDVVEFLVKRPSARAALSRGTHDDGSPVVPTSEVDVSSSKEPSVCSAGNE